MLTLDNVKEYLSENITDDIPRYIYLKEIYNEPSSSIKYITAYEKLQQARWYLELAGEQLNDGTWGRFHTLDSKSGFKRKYKTTEKALRRAQELSLTKNDPIVMKCLKKLESYVRGDETWTDKIETHRDEGKGHLLCRFYMTAAFINVFDPENPLVKPLRDNVVKSLSKVFKNGFLDKKIMEREIFNYHIPSIAIPGMYSSMLLQGSSCMDDTLQRQYLDYLWNKKDGIYYVSSVPPCEIQCIKHNKNFFKWLSALELLSGFSLFPEYMKKDIVPHLLKEIKWVMDELSDLPESHRYSETWRFKHNLKTDIILRIARVLIKC